MSTTLLRTSARAIAPFAGVIAAIVVASPSADAATAELHVNPTTVSAGQSVQVSGSCEANTSGFVLSPAFLHDATHDFAGVGAVSFTTSGTGAFSGRALIPASISPGTYSVTARCGGGNLGISVTLTVTPAGGGVPTAVPAGSGGMAATSDHSQAQVLGLGGAGALLMSIGGVALARTRSHRR